MPTGYEFLLPKILKATRVMRKGTRGGDQCETVMEAENNNKGIPQGGIISPLLMNFTLDGLEEVIFDTTLNYKPDGTRFSDPQKQEYYR